MDDSVTYIYSKGKGWIPTTLGVHAWEFISSDGKRMLLVERQPLVGERFCDWNISLNMKPEDIVKGLGRYASDAYSKWYKGGKIGVLAVIVCD